MENNYHITSLNISADLGREEIYELGRKRPYFQFAHFPAEILCGQDLGLDKIHYNCKCVEVIINV